MAEPERCRRREEDSDTVFIETSLGTRLVTVFPTSVSFTVSDAKRKLELEHSELYPEKGVIEILKLQVELQGSLYCLSNSMPLASAFVGSIQSPKSLAVEASCSVEPVVQRSERVENNISVGRNAAPCVNAAGANRVSNRSVVNNLDPVANVLALPAHHGLSNGTKNKKRAKKRVVIGEQSKSTDKNVDFVPQIENDRVEMDGSVPADFLAQSGLMGSTGTAGPKKKRKKVGKCAVQTEDHKENDRSNVVEMDGSVPADFLAQSEAMGGTGSAGPEKKKKKRKKVEKCAVQTEDNTNVVEMDGSVPAEFLAQSKAMGGSGSAGPKKKRKKVAVQTEDNKANDRCNAVEMDGSVPADFLAQSEAMGATGSAGHGKKKKRKKVEKSAVQTKDNKAKAKKERKRSHSSAAHGISTSEMKEQSLGAEGLVVPLLPFQEVGSVDVNAADLDGAAVKNGSGMAITDQPDGENPKLDQLGSTSLMKEEKRVKSSELEQQDIAEDVAVAAGEALKSTETTGITKLPTEGEIALPTNPHSPIAESSTTQVPLEGRPEMGFNADQETVAGENDDQETAADEKIDFLAYFTAGEKQSESTTGSAAF